MADNYGLFWNSVEGDRNYDADSFSEWLNKFFTTGVFQNDLQVTANGGLTIKVGTGYANIHGKVRFFDSETTFQITRPNDSLSRIDTVVIERNDTDREITLKVIDGSPSLNPVPHTRVDENGVYQIVLAHVYVASSATAISQSNITDRRADSQYCGWVTGTVEEIDLQQILAQSEAQFNEWFNEMKDQLSEDAAGNLQEEIDDANARITTNEGNITQLDTDVANLTTHTNVQIVTTANANLDDYKTTGIYFFASQYTPRNIPAGTDGWLLVFGNPDGYVKQVWLRTGSVDATDHEMYSRLYAAFRIPPVWSAWSKYVAEEDVPALVKNTLKTVDRSITLHSGIQTSASGMYYKQTTVTGITTIYSVSISNWQNLPAGASVTPYFYVDGNTKYVGVLCSTNTFPSANAQVTLRVFGS